MRPEGTRAEIVSFYLNLLINTYNSSVLLLWLSSTRTCNSLCHRYRPFYDGLISICHELQKVLIAFRNSDNNHVLHGPMFI